MNGHFRAFSLVDRITEFEPGQRARGTFVVPARIARFPSSLAAEAVGQLAAWLAMAQLDFELRPVAGVAGDLHFGAEPKPGQTLELNIEIESCDRELVTYSGRAYADGVALIELEHSAGPMLPMEGFDAPEAVRERYELLIGRGAPTGQFPGVAEHEIEMIEEVYGKRARALLKVPREAEFFSDHFPRRPVFPGTMLLDAHIQVALAAAAHSGYWEPGARVRATRVPNMKLRSFIAPGDTVELRVELTPPNDTGAVLTRTSAHMNGKQIALGGLELTVPEGEQ
jgi:3-hydroxymyristoyl/3-hydroxydecanoyl-(acyl carrier protein) dehydratase